MSVENPIVLIVGLLIAVVGVVLVRKARLLPVASRIAGALAVMLLALAAGDVAWLLHVPANVVVVIDRSPSTRGASYRDPGALDALIDLLLPDVRVQQVAFADGDAPLSDGPIDDVGVDQTRLPSLPPADAYLLLSDGHWHAPPPPVAGPVFAFVDPQLRTAEDRAVRALELRGERVGILLRATSPGTLSLADAPAVRFPAGRPVIELDLSDAGAPLVARVEPGDRWPENDSLTLLAVPGAIARRVWIGEDPPAGFESAEVRSAADLLDAAVVVLAGGRASTEAIDAYVRRAGGVLIILAGDPASAAISAGDTIDALSPLSVTAPEPTHRWMILVDASGSMAQPTRAGLTRWQQATQAAQQAARALPRGARVDAGGFAAALQWWQRSTPPAQIAPPAITPAGPTNLQSALEQLLLESSNLPGTLLLVSDGRATIDQPAQLADRFRAGSIVPHLLAIDGAPDPSTRAFFESAGGSITPLLPEIDWSVAAANVMQREATSSLLRDDPLVVRWIDRSGLAARAIGRHRVGWARDGSTLIASVEQGNPLVASWSAGLGEVTTILFTPSDPELAWLVRQKTRQAEDPRFRVKMSAGRIEVTALDDDRPINALRLVAQLDDSLQIMEQSAPGEYALTWPRASQQRLLTILLDGRPIARRVIAGGYPAEFDEIGINDDALQSIADTTGGAVIREPAALPIPRPVRRVRLQWPLLLVSAALLAAGLYWWRSGR